MSEKGYIDSALYRPLQTGSRYNSAMPHASCKSTYLGTGDTYFSMDAIKEYIEKYNGQVKKLAPLLRKPSLSQTVTSIYNFLYNHIQYMADGSDQILRSPACSWAVRNEGIDCKSYSIFAGCILAQMGIKFSIRKIKQPGMAPDEFTHVYIVVPKNQKTGELDGGYHVIDATKHQNTEAAYTVKKDEQMSLKHYGLNAPAHQNAHPLPARNMQDRFSRLLSILKNETPISPTILAGLTKHLETNKQKCRPSFVNIKKEGIVLDRKLYPFEDAEGNYFLPRHLFQRGTGLNGDGGEVADGGEGGGDSGFFTRTWDSVKNVFNSESGSWISSIINFVMGSGCLGSSPSASQKGVREFRENYMGPWFNEEIDNLKTYSPDPTIKKVVKIFTTRVSSSFVDRLNGILVTLSTVKAHQMFHKEQSKDTCSKKGNQAKADFAQKMIDHLHQSIEGMKRDYIISKTTQTFEASKHFMPAGLDTNWKGNTITATRDVYTFQLKPGHQGGITIDPLPIESGDGNTGGSTNTGGGSNTGINPGGNTNPGGSGQYPAEYYNLSAAEQNIYRQVKAQGNMGPFNEYKKHNTPSDRLLILLGRPLPGGSSGTGSVNRNNPQQAGMSGLLMFGLIAGGIYMVTQNKKK